MFVTDYPISGNDSQQWIEVDLLSYDRNKYVTVKHGCVQECIKSGHIYKVVKGERISISYRDLFSLPREVGYPYPSNRDIEQEMRNKRLNKTTYLVWVGNNSREFSSLKCCLKFIEGKIEHTNYDIHVSRNVTQKNSWSTTPILDVEGHDVFEYAGRGARGSGFLSKTHFRKIRNVALNRNV